MKQDLTHYLSESELLAEIVRVAQEQGYLVYHTYDSRRSTGKGFPDLILVRDSCLFALEIKAERGKVTAEQQQWIKALHGVARVSSYVVRPSNWEMVKKVLIKAPEWRWRKELEGGRDEQGTDTGLL